MSKVRIVLDPTKWPTDTHDGRGTYNHIFHDQDVNPPEATLKEILRLMDLRRLRVDDMEDWWWDLGEFGMKGWKLVGHGELPNTVLHPGEKQKKTDRKIPPAPKPSPPKTSASEIANALLAPEE